MLTRGEYCCIVPGEYMLDRELELVGESQRLNLRLYKLVGLITRELTQPNCLHLQRNSGPEEEL
jgi:hypothetical protein